MTGSVSIHDLNVQLQNVKAKQGFIGKFWNGFKETFKVGVSQKDCESMLQKYQDGVISFEEAVKYIEDYDKKQKDMTNLLTNIATGVGSIAITTAEVAGGPIGWGVALAKGAPSGAILKTAIGMADRATNDVKGDVLDSESVVKDMISGAATGTTSAVSSNIGLGIKEGKLGLSLLKGAQCGAVCGTATGTIDYAVNTALDEDKKFDFGDLTKSALTSAAISTTVGAAVGGGVYGINSMLGNTGKEVARSVGQTIIRDSITSSSRKALSQAERNIINS